MSDSPAPKTVWNPLAAFMLALGVIVVGLLGSKLLPVSVTTRFPWARQAVTQGLMTAFALGAMAASGRPIAEFGFRRPAPAKGRFKLWGLMLGAASTGTMLVFGLRGPAGAYGAGWFLLWIVLISSIVEEIFCRGWFQSLVTGTGDGDSQDARTHAAIRWSTALFGTMHLALLFAGVAVAAVAIIVVSATALGYVCATARARTGSLRPAILAHMMFNIGGLLAGMIYVLIYRLTIGHIPTL